MLQKLRSVWAGKRRKFEQPRPKSVKKKKGSFTPYVIHGREKKGSFSKDALHEEEKGRGCKLAMSDLGDAVYEEHICETFGHMIVRLRSQYDVIV